MDMDTTASRRASIAATEGRRTDARESLVSTIGDYMAKLEAKEMEVIKLKQEVRRLEKDKDDVLEGWHTDRAQLENLQRTMEQEVKRIGEAGGKDAEAQQAQMQEALLQKAKVDMQRLEKEYGTKLVEMEDAYRRVEAQRQETEERLQDKERDLADKIAHIKCLHNDIGDQEGKIKNLQQEVEQFRNSNLELDRAIMELRFANERRVTQLQADKERDARTIQQLSADLEQLERDKAAGDAAGRQEKAEMKRREQAFREEAEKLPSLFERSIRGLLGLLSSENDVVPRLTPFPHRTLSVVAFATEMKRRLEDTEGQDQFCKGAL